MTVFIMKMIACLAMLLDHVAHLLQQKMRFVCPDITLHDIWAATAPLTGIGNAAFPIYAFLLVQGLSHTKSRKDYLGRLALFAFISQTPYVLFMENLSILAPGRRTILFYSALSMEFFLPHFLFIISCLACWIVWPEKDWKGKNFLFLCLAMIPMAVEELKIGGIILHSQKFSIFYTLAFGFYLCFFWEKLSDYIQRRKQKRAIPPYYPWKLLLLAAPMITAIVALRCDYGILGFILILALYLLQKYRGAHSVFIIVWGCVVYGQASLLDWETSGIVLAAVLALCYTGRKGPNIKYPFYLFYPFHLLVLGILSVTMFQY